MRNSFKKTIKTEVAKLFYDAEYHLLADWEVCQAFKMLVDRWEREIDDEMFLKFESQRYEMEK